ARPIDAGGGPSKESGFIRSAVEDDKSNCENTPAAIESCQSRARTAPMVWPNPTEPSLEARRGERCHRYVAKNSGSFGSATSDGKIGALGSAADARGNGA